MDKGSQKRKNINKCKQIYYSERIYYVNFPAQILPKITPQVKLYGTGIALLPPPWRRLKQMFLQVWSITFPRTHATLAPYRMRSLWKYLRYGGATRSLSRRSNR